MALNLIDLAPNGVMKMTKTFAYDVFISYSSKDKTIVCELARKLKNDGLHVWFDEWEIGPGDMIGLKIEQGLEQSRTLVLVMSVNAFASEWVTLEHHTALFRDPTNAQRRFIPLRLDDVEIKDSLKQFSYVDWRYKSEKQYTKLLAGIGRDGTPIKQQSSETEDDNGSNIIIPKEPIKSGLLESKFIKEMDKLVAPLNAKIGNNDIFLKGAPGYRDSNSARHQEYFRFWNKINENKYRCPNYLHSAIDNYLMNKTDKVGDRTRDLPYEKAETELFEAIRKRYSELRSIINSEYNVSAKRDFKILCRNFYTQPKNIRNDAAKQISVLAKEMELIDIINFGKSSEPGQKVGAAIAIGTHLTISKKNQDDQIITNALWAGLHDLHSRVRYRAVIAIENSSKLVNYFKDELADIAVYDDNSWVRYEAGQVLMNQKIAPE